nr:alpha-N-acetylgalactosaminide alpha-2,6-sialyltransferase 5-like [Lytechinus pictus]
MEIRDATLLVICWYSLVVSLCMLYVLHTHSDVIIGNRVSNHVAKARSDNSSPQDHSGWIRAASNTKTTTTTAGPEVVIVTTANGTEKPSGHPGYTLLDKDTPLDLRCDRCSLVSSSGQLLNSGAGADIDNADCVLRMNSATVRGYEEDVGIRTDVRVIGHVNLARGLVTSQDLIDEILGDPATRTGIVVVPWLYQEKIDKANNTVYQAARNMTAMYPNVKFYFLTPEKINKTEDRFQIETGVSLTDAKTWLSTGFVAMLFALDVCNRIDVYGLSNVDYCKRHPNSTSPYHYYEPDIRKECEYYKWSETQMTKGHKFMTEKAVFARWSLGYNIHFHYPSWRATIRNVTAELDTPFLQLYKEALKNGTLEQIRKAAPHVRVIRRVKVIRRRVRKPRPKVVPAVDEQKKLLDADGVLKQQNVDDVMNKTKDVAHEHIPDSKNSDLNIKNMKLPEGDELNKEELSVVKNPGIHPLVQRDNRFLAARGGLSGNHKKPH